MVLNVSKLQYHQAFQENQFSLVLRVDQFFQAVLFLQWLQLFQVLLGYQVFQLVQMDMKLYMEAPEVLPLAIKIIKNQENIQCKIVITVMDFKRFFCCCCHLQVIHHKFPFPHFEDHRSSPSIGDQLEMFWKFQHSWQQQFLHSNLFGYPQHLMVFLQWAGN